jgi:hypothetical protein
MPPEMSEHGGESSPVDALVIAKAGAAVDPDGKLPLTVSASIPPANRRFIPRRTLLIGVLGALVIATAVWTRLRVMTGVPVLRWATRPDQVPVDQGRRVQFRSG